MTQHVYFIRPVGAVGPIKIGCSKSPEGRLVDLMTWSPVPLELIVMVRGSYELERNLHDCFGDLRMHREWFRADARLVEAVAKIAAGVAVAEAVDLNDRRAAPAPLKWNQTESGRKMCAYRSRLGWAKRQVHSTSHYPAFPDDVNEIMARWRARQSPTVDELARLDAVIANPSDHLTMKQYRFAEAA